jgi:hypothetical protein
VARAQTAYLAAAKRLTHPFAAMRAVGVSLDPRQSGRAREWTGADVNVLRELHAALGEVLETRRRWDSIRRGSGGARR